MAKIIFEIYIQLFLNFALLRLLCWILNAHKVLFCLFWNVKNFKAEVWPWCLKCLRFNWKFLRISYLGKNRAVRLSLLNFLLLALLAKGYCRWLQITQWLLLCYKDNVLGNTISVKLGCCYREAGMLAEGRKRSQSSPS